MAVRATLIQDRRPESAILFYVEYVERQALELCLTTGKVSVACLRCPCQCRAYVPGKDKLEDASTDLLLAACSECESLLYAYGQARFQHEERKKSVLIEGRDSKASTRVDEVDLSKNANSSPSHSPTNRQSGFVNAAPSGRFFPFGGTGWLDLTAAGKYCENGTPWLTVWVSHSLTVVQVVYEKQARDSSWYPSYVDLEVARTNGAYAWLWNRPVHPPRFR